MEMGLQKMCLPLTLPQVGDSVADPLSFQIGNPHHEIRKVT